MSKAVLAMATMTLIIGGSASALALYTFLFVFPNASSSMTNASTQMRTLANDVHDLANNLPCGNGCRLLAYRNNLSFSENNLELASELFAEFLK